MQKIAAGKTKLQRKRAKMAQTVQKEECAEMEGQSEQKSLELEGCEPVDSRLA